MDGELVSPDRFHERRAANGPVRVEDQTSQHRALPARSEHDDLAVVADDIDPSQDPKEHAARVTPFSLVIHGVICNIDLGRTSSGRKCLVS
jgi:hypothetical protein